MNPYRDPAQVDEYSPVPYISPLDTAHLICIPWMKEARECKQDRFSYINLRNSGMLSEGPNGRVALTFTNVSYLYPSFWRLQADLRNMWKEYQNV